MGGFECLPAQIYDGKLDPGEVSSRNEDLVSEAGGKTAHGMVETLAG